MNDPIGDMLTRIRNAILVGKTQVLIPYSKLREEVASQLAKNGFIEKVEVTKSDKFKDIKIELNKPGENSKISEITRISKPGRRAYAKADEIPYVKNGRGIVVLSTSKGIMTDKEARSKRLGGELMCKVY